MLTLFLKLVIGLTARPPGPRPGVLGLELRYALRDLHRARFHVVYRRCPTGVAPAVVVERRRGRTVRLVLEPMHSQGVGSQPRCSGLWTFVR